jgi:hypothetical protein
MLQPYWEPARFLGVEAIMLNPHHTLWSIWIYLPALPRLFCLILFLVGIYTFFSATIMLIRIRSLPKQHKIEDISSLQRALVALHAGSSNLHQLICATFYLFGFMYFLTLPLAFISLGDNRPGWMLIFENLSIYFVFAANVFFIFLVLHSIQWFVASKVRASARRLNVQTSPG